MITMTSVIWLGLKMNLSKLWFSSKILSFHFNRKIDNWIKRFKYWIENVRKCDKNTRFDWKMNELSFIQMRRIVSLWIKLYILASQVEHLWAFNFNRWVYNWKSNSKHFIPQNTWPCFQIGNVIKSSVECLVRNVLLGDENDGWV